MGYLEKILEQYGVSDQQQVAETQIATVWKVIQQTGEPAALKIYHGFDDRNEGPGLDLLKSWAGGPAAEIIAQERGVVLLEWLGGETLGDLSRKGDDAKANEILIATALKCHAMKAPVLSTYQTVEETFRALFELRYASTCRPDLVSAMNACAQLARNLLDSAPTGVPLHGDLHHDNVLNADRGWCVIDAKGVVGDPAYELANAFRNPLGNDALIRNSKRTQALARDWAEAVGCTPKRALGWAAAHSAVSMAWATNGALEDPKGSDLPGFFLSQYAEV